MTSSENQALLERIKDGPTKASVTTSSSFDLGALVECAYEMYNADKSNLTPPPPSNFPSSKYKIVSYILFTDFFDKSQTQRFYGFLAQNLTKAATYAVVIRGTQGWEEWWDDFHIRPVPYEHGGQVEEGFYDIFKTMATALSNSDEQVSLTDQIAQLADAGAGATAPTFNFVGHSLGSALVNFAALDAAIKLGSKANVTLTTFACPLTGDQTFVNLLEQYVPVNTRIVNVPDIVPDIPPGQGYVHVNTEFLVNSQYYSNIKRSYGCYHSLLTYLYCLDPTNAFGLEASCKV